MAEYSYSTDQENYQGPFDTREDAVAEAIASNHTHFWTGENVTPDPSHYIHADTILEHITSQDEFCGDWGADWPAASKEQEEELTEMLREAFKKWMEKHGLAPLFWSIKNVREHEVEMMEIPINKGGQR